MRAESGERRRGAEVSAAGLGMSHGLSHAESGNGGRSGVDADEATMNMDNKRGFLANARIIFENLHFGGRG